MADSPITGLQELQPVKPQPSSPRDPPPRWVGLAGLVAALIVAAVGIGMFGRGAPDAADVAFDLDPTTTSTTLTAVDFPDVLVASPAGVRIEGARSRAVAFECAERAIDDLSGGLLVDLCEGGIVHLTSDGEQVDVAGERFELHFVEHLGFGETPLAVAFDKYPLIDSMDAVGYDVEQRSGEIDSIPRFSWYAASPRVQALVGFDLGGWVVAEGCMQIQTIEDSDQTTSIGCRDTEDPVVAAAVSDSGRDLAYVSRTGVGRFVLRILELESNETTASVRIEGQPLSLSYDGQFSAFAIEDASGIRSTLIDMDSYAKREFDGLATLIREPVVVDR